MYVCVYIYIYIYRGRDIKPKPVICCSRRASAFSSSQSAADRRLKVPPRVSKTATRGHTARLHPQ